LPVAFSSHLWESRKIQMLLAENKPVIVQSDGSILLEVQNDAYEDARDAILPFAELVKSPEYVHTYRITPISLWNAAAIGAGCEDVINALRTYSRYDIPPIVETRIKDAFSRWDAVRLLPAGNELKVEVKEKNILERLLVSKQVQECITSLLPGKGFKISKGVRGRFKHIMIKLGFPVNDLVGYEQGDPLNIPLRKIAATGDDFRLRRYQIEAIDNFWAGGSARGGQGIVVLPCGAGKTVVGMGVMEKANTYTLILCTNVAAVHQWINEILDKTRLRPDDVGEYTSHKKDIKPVTVTTYQILTHRRSKTSPFEHMHLMMAKNWGLLIYDEVHVLPAPVFRATTEIQAKRRLGLTATLVREDGLEEDTFSLIGPKCYDVPWKELESKGFIAEAICYEIRLPMPRDLEIRYINESDRLQFRTASENPYKEYVAKDLIKKHPDEPVLVIGQYLTQLKKLSSFLKAPLITGGTPNAKREELYQAFRNGNVPVLVVSRVANFAIDLPDASVAIQVSGTFGSRQEEAQRLGRILRPKKRISSFYSLVTANTAEDDFAHKRQVFLAEQGYKYRIEEWTEDDINT
jgi:DNA excision repair protein ERCC-3